MSTPVLFLLHTISTAFMTGLIWFVQLVHYPSFYYLDRARFITAMSRHRSLTSLVVAPVMLCELLSWAAIVYFFSSSVSRGILWANSLALIGIWVATYFVSMPRHERLSQGYDVNEIQSLVNTNWLRVILWSGRCLFLFSLMRNLSR